MLNRPSPLAIEHRLAGLVGILPVKDAFAFPDWAAASLMALLTFFMIRIGKKNWKMRISVLGLILFFAFCRVNGAFSFFSDVIAGIGIGAIMGFLFAKLLSRVEKQASG